MRERMRYYENVHCACYYVLSSIWMLLTIMCMLQWHTNRIGCGSNIRSYILVGAQAPFVPYTSTVYILHRKHSYSFHLCGMHYLFITQPITFLWCFFHCAIFNPLHLFSRDDSFCARILEYFWYGTSRPLFSIQWKGYILHWIFNRVLFISLLHSKSNRFCWVEFNFEREFRRPPSRKINSHEQKNTQFELYSWNGTKPNGTAESKTVYCVCALWKKWQTLKNGNFQSYKRKKNIFVGVWKYRSPRFVAHSYTNDVISMDKA